VGPNDGSISVAACPSSEFLITGGGGTIAGPADNVRLGGIHPADFFDPDSIPNDVFFADAFNNTAQAQNLKSYAICLRDSAGGSDLDYSFNDGPTINQGSSVGTGATANCTGGRLVGGGLEIPGPATAPNEEQLNSSHPSDSFGGDGIFDNGWSGKLNVNSSSVERAPRAHAICLPQGVMKMRYRYETRVVFDAAATAKAKCPPGYRVSGGGSQGFFSRMLSSRPFDGKDKGKAPDDGWQVKVWKSPGADPSALLVHAICLRPKG
jgi:hypothetical protein